MPKDSILTAEQTSQGMSTRRDDDCIYLYFKDARISIFNLNADDEAIRKEADRYLASLTIEFNFSKVGS